MANDTDILDPKRLELIRTKLFTAVLGDVMDARGLTRQFLPPEIRALDPDMMIAGYAMPVLEADCCGDVEGQGGRSNPFGLMLRALDELKRDEVYICTGGSPRYALWGELMSTRAQTLGAAGAAGGGYHPDTPGVRRPGFPGLSLRAHVQGPRGRGGVLPPPLPDRVGQRGQ